LTGRFGIVVLVVIVEKGGQHLAPLSGLRCPVGMTLSVNQADQRWLTMNKADQPCTAATAALK
jgi:hypothetical protein